MPHCVSIIEGECIDHVNLIPGIIEEAAQKAKEGMEEWNGTDRPERKV